METVWGNKQIYRLIQVYRQHSVLWDPSDNYYKNRLKKDAAWADIAEQMNLTQREVETKVHILRSQFSREKKKMRALTANGVRQSKWRWFKPLQFLLCQAASATSNTVGTDERQGALEPGSPPSSPSPTSYIHLPTPTPSWPPLSHSKRKSDIPRETENARKKKESTDEFDIYAQYVASELRNVRSEKTVLQAKYQINNILIQARLGNLDGKGFGGRWEVAGATSSTADALTEAPTTDYTEDINNLIVKIEDDAL